MASASTQQLRTLQFQDLLSLSLSHASHESHLVLSVGNVVSCAGMLLRKPLIAVKGLHGTRFRYNVSILDKSMNDRDEWKLVTLSSLCDPSSYPLRSTFGKKRKLDESIASWKVIRREFLPMFFLLREINSKLTPACANGWKIANRTSKRVIITQKLDSERNDSIFERVAS